MNFRTHAMRSPKLRAHLKYPISKPFFFEHFPQQNLTAPLQGWGTHKIIVCFVRHTKKKHVSSLLCPYGEISETIFQSIRTKGPKHSNCASDLVGIDNLNKNPAWFLQRPKYRFSNIETCPKGPNYRYAKFSRQSHRWAKSPKSRIKILISEYY